MKQSPIKHKRYSQLRDTRLAIKGGTPVLAKVLPSYPSIGEAEEAAVLRVIRSGQLSGFYGSLGPQFLGGTEVRAFEQEWAARFQVPHAVSVNSATSGLFTAIGAVGIGPGDEVIVPPTTMSATVVAPLVYGAIPVFADIEDQTFGLDPARVRECITMRTRAIIATNLFGHPARLTELKQIADEHGLFLIEDNAQGPLATEDGRYAGTIGHIGVFSLNYHKHIHTGEGGMCVTYDKRIAERLQLIRNHGENLTDAMATEDLASLYGFNYRMTELSAAVGRAQLAAADTHVEMREKIARRLTEAVCNLEGLQAPRVREGCRHVYYVWTLCYDEEVMGVSREVFSRALAAEGFPHFTGYVRPLYRLPLFQKRIAMGRNGFPFSQSMVRYEGELCPVAERLWRRKFLCFETCAYDLDDECLDKLTEAVIKLHRHRHELTGGE